MEIASYLEMLSQRLLRYNIKFRYTQRICKDIRNRMLSLLGIWNNKEARNAILFLSLEEAPFYLPLANKNVSEFVVTTVRNSMLEIAASDNCGELKMSEPLSSAQIKEITSEAILYFDKIDFEILSKKCGDNFIDVYNDALCKYSLSWKALVKIANMETQTLEIANSAPEKAMQQSDNVNSNNEIKKTVFDGFTTEIEPPLMEKLNSIKENGGLLYVDSSKMLTRNFEKYLRVLEMILESNGEFCTSNYYISKTRLEKRKVFLKAAHTTEEVGMKLKKSVDAPPNIKKCMESFI